MDERKIKILNSIIKSYTESKEPIGSRSLSKSGEIGVSAATIRNEMSDLEELGYLTKVHASSGRVPSNSGYRLYVDALLSDEIPFDIGPQQLFDMRTIDESSEFENVITNAAKILSAITNYTAFAMLPELKNLILKYINIVYLSPKDLVIVYIYNSKEVRSDTIRLKGSVDRTTVDLINSLLNSTLLNLNQTEVLENLQSNIYEILSQKHTVLNEIIPVIEKTTKIVSNPRMIFEGIGNIFVYNQGDIDNNGNIVNLLKDDNLLIDLLSYDLDSGLQVFIGEEIGIEELNNFSIITVVFKNSQGIKGKLGILGPNSMKYEKIISDLILMSKYINGHIERR